MASKTHRAAAASAEQAGATVQVSLSSETEVSLGLDTYTRTSDGATMVQIAPHSYLSAAHLALTSGRGRAM
jgi:hypothetical protein